MRHKRSNKEAPLSFAYRPLLLSTRQLARTTTTTEIVGGHGNRARRFAGRGGAVMAEEPLKWVDGKASYEVVIHKYAGSADEGVEIGVTTTPPDQVRRLPSNPARPNPLLSDPSPALSDRFCACCTRA